MTCTEKKQNRTKSFHVNFVAINYGFFPVLLLSACLFFAGCDKEDDEVDPAPTANLALDSLSTTKKHIVVWEEIIVTAHARGVNLIYKWETSSGSMIGKDSVSVRYWGCPSCVGYNTIQCTVSNEFGSISDTLMVQVDP